jgi:hypothetical protein
MTLEGRTAPDRALLNALVPAPILVVQVGLTQAMPSKLQVQTPVAQHAPGRQVGVVAVRQAKVAGDQLQPRRVSAEVQGELELR